MRRFLAVALGLIVGFGFSVSFGPQVFGALPANLNDRFMAVFGDAGGGTTYLRVSAVTDAAGALPANLNDRWYNAFVDAGGGLTALQVVCTGCGGGTATSVTLADTAIAYGDSSNVMTGNAAILKLVDSVPLLQFGPNAFSALASFQGIVIGSNDSFGWGPSLAMSGNLGDATYAHFDIYSAQGNSATPTVSTSGDRILRMSSLGYTGAAFSDGAMLETYVDGTPGGGRVPGRFSFHTTSESAALTEVVRMSGDRRVSAASSVQVGGIVSLNVGSGQLGLVKTSGTNQSPGAGGAKIAILCGTNAGTAKLVIYAGTSTTGVDVVDNIGAGVTGC